MKHTLSKGASIGASAFSTYAVCVPVRRWHGGCTRAVAAVFAGYCEVIGGYCVIA
jgi:hypothetical protein